MRDTFEFIDAATDVNDQMRHALYELGAQAIAAQAFALANATTASIDAEDARRIVEQVVGYPGVTARWMSETKSKRVGDRATEIVIKLAKMRLSFYRS
jgi:hypothetical protein